METDKKVTRQLSKIFALAIKDKSEDKSFLEKLAANPQEVLQSSGLALTADELNAHLPFTERGEINGLQALQFVNSVLVGLVDGSKSGRIVSPPPPPPPPPPRWYPSREALEAHLTVALKLIVSGHKARVQGKARSSVKNKSKKRSTRQGRRR
jgi:hypothetical protein